MFRRLLCIFGHKYSLAHVFYHQYFECTRCKSRTVVVNWHKDTPIDYSWLKSSKEIYEEFYRGQV